jgi:hypothetical protein
VAAVYQRVPAFLTPTSTQQTTNRFDCRRAGGGLTATRDGGGGGSTAAEEEEEEGEGAGGYDVLARASVSQNGCLMSRRGCSLPANASSVDPHRASITSRFGQVSLWDGSALAVHCSAQPPRAMHAPTARGPSLVGEVGE